MCANVNKFKAEVNPNCNVKVRYIQVLLCALLEGVVIGSRILLSIAIVAMTTPNSSTNPNVPVYNWNVNSVILSSFYWSHAFVQLLAGWMVQKKGPKWFLLGSVTLDSLINCVIPIVADTYGSDGLMACRIVQGMAQGIAEPTFINLMGRWLPAEERTWLASMIWSGGYLGAIAAKLLTGFIAASWLGWPAMFYAFGVTGVVFSGFGTWLLSNRPSVHPYISKEEKEYIEKSLGQSDSDKAVSIPWGDIFTSMPYYAIIVAFVGASWGVTLLQTELPTYFSTVVGLSITKNSVFSTVPYLVAAICKALLGPIIDYIINKNYLSRTNTRRIFHAAGSFLCCISLAVLTYLPNSEGNALSVFIICYIGKTALQHEVNGIDISPRFTGVFLSYGYFIGQLVSMFAPLCVQFIVYDQGNIELWRTIFLFTSVLYALTGVFFVSFMSAERLWWDEVVTTVADNVEYEKEII